MTKTVQTAAEPQVGTQGIPTTVSRTEEMTWKKLTRKELRWEIFKVAALHTWNNNHQVTNRSERRVSRGAKGSTGAKQVAFGGLIRWFGGGGAETWGCVHKHSALRFTSTAEQEVHENID